MQWINRCDTVIYHLSNDFHQFLTISYHLTKTQSILLYPYVWRVSEEIKLDLFAQISPHLDNKQMNT